MNKTRILGLVVGAVVVVAVALLVLGFFAAPTAQGNNTIRIGFGDLRVFESKQALSKSSQPVINNSYVGIGELRRFEAQPVTNSYAGMGDLRRIEQQETIMKTGFNPVGIGDLRRYEALQSGTQNNSSNHSACPSVSSPAGERDAGASAPANVLKAMGCALAPNK